MPGVSGGGSMPSSSSSPSCWRPQSRPTSPRRRRLSPFRDPEDGAFDLSGWLASRTGMIPVPVPITEPAVGYGAALALVTSAAEGSPDTRRRRRPSEGRTARHRRGRRGAHRERDVGRGRRVHRPLEDRWRYKGAVARLSLTLDYYSSNDKAYAFTMDGWGVYQELGRRIGKSDLFGGLQLAYLNTTTGFDQAQLPPEITRRESDMTEAGAGPSSSGTRATTT